MVTKEKLKAVFMTAACILVMLASVACDSERVRDVRDDPVVKNHVDWEDFLARHDLLWTEMPELYQAAAFMGNGQLGASVYQLERYAAMPGQEAGEIGQGIRRNDPRLTWHVGRSDVVFRGNRIPVGELLLTPSGEIESCEMRMDLWNAELTGKLGTDRGTIHFRSFVHTDEMVLVIETVSDGDETVAFEWMPGLARNPRHFKGGGSRIPPEEINPEPIRRVSDGVEASVQSFNTGGGHAVAWLEREQGDNSRVLYLSVGFSPDDDGAEREAVEAVNRAADLGLDPLESTHREWWHAYYPASFLSIPDTRLEGYYWIQMYKLASATREGRVPMDLMGPWYRHTPWPKIWWNLNAQLAYWPILEANRLELGKPLLDMLGENMDALAANAGGFHEDSAAIHTATSYDLVGRVGREISNLPWTMHNVWLHYRYSMDDEVADGVLFPLLRRSINFYRHHLEEGPEGHLHISIGSSPEYPNQPRPNPDCNIDLALLRWGCKTLLYLSDKLDIDDPLIPEWMDILDRLVPYPEDENGYMVSASVPFAEPHRHYSHLMMIFPLYLVNWEQPENRERIARSFDHWAGMKQFRRKYSMSGAASMSAAMNRADEAVGHLHAALAGGGFDYPSTLYTSSGPCLEGPFATASAIHDLLIQSWGHWTGSGDSVDGIDYQSIIRVFPAIPEDWKDVAFRDLRTEGAFLVSASRRDGATEWVSLTSLAGQPCRIRPSLKGDVQATAPITYLGEGIYEVDVRKGDTAILYVGDEAPVAVIEPVAEEVRYRNFFGLSHDAFETE